MALLASRHFVVGDTVFMYVKTSKPGTRTPEDADTVTLVSLTEDGLPVVPPVVDFTRIDTGSYELALVTDGWGVGVYKVIVRVFKAPNRAKLLSDEFVLSPP